MSKYQEQIDELDGRNAEIRFLNKVIKELEPDAARYQFLRVKNNEFAVSMNIGHDWIEEYGENLDRAIDKAISR